MGKIIEWKVGLGRRTDADRNEAAVMSEPKRRWELVNCLIEGKELEQHLEISAREMFLSYVNYLTNVFLKVNQLIEYNQIKNTL